MREPVTDAVIAWLREQGHELELIGPLVEGDETEWAEASAATARAVTDGDAETARLARKYNHANVLVMSMRATSPAIAVEITEAFLGTPWGEDDFDIRNVRVVDGLA